MMKGQLREAVVPTLKMQEGDRSFPKRGKVRWVWALILLILAGCTPKLYNIDMHYEPTKTIRPTENDGRKFSITVASLIDQRNVPDTVIIGRVIQGDGTVIPILPQYVKPMDAVTMALRSLMTQAGYGVAPDRPVWDLQEATIRPEWGTLLVGGTVDALDVTCYDHLTKTSYNAKARVTLVFADVRKKRIFYRISAESISSLDHLFFSEERLQNQINAVLSDAMEKILEGPEVARKIREALRAS